MTGKRLPSLLADHGVFQKIRKVLAEIGRRGGLARAKAMTAKQRKESALKASKAAAKARTKKARAKAGNGQTIEARHGKPR